LLDSPTVTGQPASPAAPTRQQAPRPPERRRELLIYWAYRAGERLMGLLPRRLVLAGAAAAGNAAYDLAGAKRRIVRENLARPAGLDPDHPQVGRAARRAFRNYVKYLVDVMRLADAGERQLDEMVTIRNFPALAEAQAGGRGVLLCTVHVGGMDLIAPALHREGEELHVVADDTTYGRLYEHLRAVRAHHGISLIGWRNLRGLFRVLKRGENLVLFCDGGYRAGDVPVEFLGEPTTFPAGPATLSARTGAPMLPVANRRTRSERLVTHGLPLIRAASEEPAELHRATQELADALGSVIADDPGQWYMFRPVWPQTDEDRSQARAALEAARRGEDWARI
jgi:phosphatidylinositol dimannoside acyltransferase